LEFLLLKFLGNLGAGGFVRAWTLIWRRHLFFAWQVEQLLDFPPQTRLLGSMGRCAESGSGSLSTSLRGTQAIRYKVLR
jgi:hypothetical protein